MINLMTKKYLKELQSECLSDKIQRSFEVIGRWYNYFNDNVYVSFSGGKDSSVLADITAKWCSLTNKSLYLVFVDTGLEYPEIRNHVKVFAEYLRKKYEIEVNLEILRPKMSFVEVIKKYGYPIISKEVAITIEYFKKGSCWAVYKLKGKNNDGTVSERKKTFVKYAPIADMDFNVSSYCCGIMKKKPAKLFEKSTGRKPIIASLAVESSMRENAWLQNGCNAYDSKRPISNPMSFWTEQDVYQYIKKYNLPIASVYGDIVYASQNNQMRLEDYGVEDCGTDKLCTTGCDRTGCIFCGFGCHLEKSPSRFERLKETHPRQYEYCMGGGEYVNGLWQPNKQGLGLKHVFDTLNKLYGDKFIKY